MQRMNKIRTEQILYLLAFLLALGIRLLNLGKAPLSDFEAGWATQSFALAHGQSVTLGAQPGYIFPTTLLFSIFADTNFLARLWPALAGSLLVLAPYAFRRKLGQKAALIAAFGLALDPGMVALSRLAGGPMLAIAFTVLALALLFAGQFAWGGVAAGLALLSGPAVINGLLGLGIAYGLARLAGLFREVDLLPDDEPPLNPARVSAQNWRQALFFGGGAILIVSTLFSRYPQGLGAWAATLNAYLQNWTQFSGIPAGRLLAVIFFYALLPLIFGLIAAVRGWLQKQNTARFLSFWLLAALVLSLLMSGRAVYDVAWALLPLWALAGMEIARYARRDEHWLVSLGQAALVVVLLVMIWLTLAALDTVVVAQAWNYWIVVGAAVLIGVLVTALVFLGWSKNAAQTGLVWGLVIGLAAYSLANVFGVSQVHAHSPLELWQPVPTTRYADLLADTLHDLALTQTGNADFLEVVSLVDAPSLRWVLRNIEGVSYATGLSPDVAPLIVITRADDLAGVRQDLYRGQDFGWWDSPGWVGALPSEMIRWLTSRDAPVTTESVVLWARLDLFPDEPANPDEPVGELNVEDTSPPSDNGVLEEK